MAGKCRVLRCPHPPRHHQRDHPSFNVRRLFVRRQAALRNQHDRWIGRQNDRWLVRQLAPVSNQRAANVGVVAVADVGAAEVAEVIAIERLNKTVQTQ